LETTSDSPVPIDSEQCATKQNVVLCNDQAWFFAIFILVIGGVKTVTVRNFGNKSRGLLAAALMYATTFYGSVTPASAETCYEVVKAKSIYMRAKPRMNSVVVTALKGGTLLRKVGLPVCGLWWCKVETGSSKHVGYIGSKFLKKEPCP
jgi:hypothetical protein